MISLFNPIQTNGLSRNEKIKNLLWGTVNSTIFGVPLDWEFFGDIVCG